MFLFIPLPPGSLLLLSFSPPWLFEPSHAAPVEAHLDSPVKEFSVADAPALWAPVAQGSLVPAGDTDALLVLVGDGEGHSTSRIP